jgi:site-specific recombinase XerD
MHSKQTLSTLIWANTSKKDKTGLVPLYLRITIDGKRAEISLGKKTEPEKWNSEKSCISGNSAEVKTFNHYLSTIKSDIHKLFIQLSVLHEKLTPQMLSDSYLGKEPKNKEKTLIDVFQYHNKKFKEKAERGLLSKKTHARFEILLGKIVKFMLEEYGQKDRVLSAVKHQFATDLEHYFTVKQNLGSNTAMKYIKMLKTILNVAVANEWLPSNPLTNFKCTYVSPDREVLTQAELNLIYNKAMPNARMECVRDVFIFACYTGYAFSDLEQFEHNAVTRGIDGELWLKTNRVKTDVAENVLLLDIPLAIIEKYSRDQYCLNANKLLPVNSNQRYNSYLKELATICNIQKHLTSHIARHTFATTVTLANGISLESVSAMLGHRSVRTTQIYAKVVQSKLSNEMRSLKEKFSGVQLEKATAKSI